MSLYIMANPGFSYYSEQRLSSAGIQHVFVSTGDRDIIKVVEYTYVQPFLQKDLYNLGFGDYDAETDQLLDESTSNNGDQYRVFNTVLNTIPDFFSHFPTAMVAVQGSDSHPDFIARCQSACVRNCGPRPCRNAHRRIRIYRRYIEENHEALTAEYDFHGGFLKNDNQIVIEKFIVGSPYTTVLVSKKMLPL
jgi:hypothetical protein